MKGGSSTAGYTVLELLIVLAVSMFLMVSAMILMSGRQARTEFTTAVRSLQGEIQQTLNEVASGYYPNINGVICSVTAPNIINLSSTGGDTQGTNPECVYMGRVLQFNTDSPDQDTYNVFTVVGRNNQTSISGANPRVIAKGTAEAASTIPDDFETRKLRSNLKVSKLYYSGNQANTINAFAFLSNLGQNGVGDGSQIVNMLRIGGPAAPLGPMVVTTPVPTPAAVDYINANLPLAATSAIYMCVDSGSTRQSARLLIGENYRYNSVETRFYANPGCS